MDIIVKKNEREVTLKRPIKHIYIQCSLEILHASGCTGIDDIHKTHRSYSGHKRAHIFFI